MGRERRRRGGTARSRRTPSRPSSSSNRSFDIPLVPIAVAVGIVAAVALVAFLIWQQGKSSGSATSAAAEVEKDPAPDLPGEYVNLPEIYADERGLATYGSDGVSVPNTAPHVTGDVDYAGVGNSNPPAGGPHWAGGTCPQDPEQAPRGCGPAQWGIYRKPWRPEVLVHNMEHGGIVIWYNTTDQSVIDDMESYAKDLFPVVMAPYPDMEPETIALTSWARIDKFPVSEYSRQRVEDYANAHLCRFNPESLPDC